jgi:hypothetical protein
MGATRLWLDKNGANGFPHFAVVLPMEYLDARLKLIHCP